MPLAHRRRTPVPLARQHSWPAREVLAAAVLVGILAACGSAASGSVSPTPAGSSSVPTVGPAATKAPTPSVPTPTPTLRVGPYGLVIDPSLLRLLPATVAGLPVSESQDLESAALGDQDVAGSTAAYAAAVVGSLSDPDWAQVQFLSLKPGVGKTFYAAWRDQVEQAGCSQASGIATRSQKMIGGRLVDVTTCVGGAILYQLQLVDRGILVSVTAIGTKLLGQQALAVLQP